MKRFVFSLVMCMMGLLPTFAQADKIVGEYQCERNGVQSKVKIFKHEDGSIRKDPKNPDASKRNTRADQIVLIEKVKFDGKENWKDGKIYDPTSGKVYGVTLSFENNKTLKVRGYKGISLLGESMYWTKIK